tara:strand:- start:184 stop:777 length:594 start_codon:yes stop_codon:yes gene_type:complete
MNRIITDIKRNFEVKRILQLLLLTFLLFGIANSCCFEKTGSSKLSDNSEISKKNGLFISNWKIIENPIVVNDTFRLEITDVWMEKFWHIDPQECRKIKIIPNIYQVGFNVASNTDRPDYKISWYFIEPKFDCWINPKNNGYSIINCPLEADSLRIEVFFKKTDSLNIEKDFKMKEFILVKEKQVVTHNMPNAGYERI